MMLVTTDATMLFFLLFLKLTAKYHFFSYSICCQISYILYLTKRYLAVNFKNRNTPFYDMMLVTTDASSLPCFFFNYFLQCTQNDYLLSLMLFQPTLDTSEFLYEQSTVTKDLNWRKPYHFGTWDKITILGWTIPLRYC